MATVLDKLLAIEKKLPTFIKEDREATDKELAMLSNEQIETIQEWDRLKKLYKDPNQRDALNIANVGKQAQGKSTYTRQRIVDDTLRTFEKHGKQRRILIYLPNSDRNYNDLPQIDAVGIIADSMLKPNDPRKWKHGARVWFGKNHELNLTIIRLYYTNGMCVFEEANEFFVVNGSAPKWQLVIFSQNRHRAVDNVINLHRLMDIPKSIRGFFSIFNLFKTDDNPPNSKWLFDNGFPGDADMLYKLLKDVKRIPHDPSSKIQDCLIFDARTTSFTGQNSVDTDSLPLKDWQLVLGVEHSATLEDVKEAYKELAKMYHPDRNDNDGSKEMMQKINQAYKEAKKALGVRH